MSRFLNIATALLVLVVGVLVYRAKTEAKRDEARLEALREDVAAQERALKVLQAEIAHLENPERLRRLALRHLGLTPIDPLRVVTLEEAPLLLAWGRDALDARDDAALEGLAWRAVLTPQEPGVDRAGGGVGTPEGPHGREAEAPAREPRP